ncbi:MAG: Xaa-Pro peptidase family protein [Rhodospirillaceae bacterium]|nr:Xaa-Pro peptidase family protein [Rhodospirillaceae bacterium]
MTRDFGNTTNTSRQHGAMEHTIPPCDLDEVRRYRLRRVREALAPRDLAGIILYDPVNIRYATDSPNMQVWCTHNEARYLYVPAEGPVTLFEFGGGSDLLTAGLPTIDEVRAATFVLYFIAGGRQADNARAWAAELDSLIRERSGGNRRIAIDRIGPMGIMEMQRLGYEIHDGFEVMENARTIKSAGEIALMRHAMVVCEQAIEGMREALRPGITENALWAELHRGNIERGGEWIECRLLASGPRTNPWFRESSMRVIERGDIVAFDTDLIGPYGYCADISRTWVCDARPSDEQRRIYAEAYAHIQHDKALLKPGVTFRELTELARPFDDEFVEGRYSVAMHGVGLCDEYPAIPYPQDYEPGDDGVMEAGMVMCVEALVAPAGGREAVKLEEQVLITADGYEQLSSYPLEEDWL